MKSKLAKHVCGVRLFVMHKPSPNLRAVWHCVAMHMLRGSREGGGRKNTNIADNKRKCNEPQGCETKHSKSNYG